MGKNKRFFQRTWDYQKARKESPAFPPSGDFWLGNSLKGGRLKNLCVLALSPLEDRKEPSPRVWPDATLAACWHGAEAWRCPELVLLDAALLPHTEQYCSTNPARTSRGPAYLPMGLTGDLIGVAQNFQLHVRLKDPASGNRKIKRQISDF